MKKGIQQTIGVIKNLYVTTKQRLLFFVSGQFKKPTNNPDLIDINTIDIGNLKTTMFCDLKIDSNKLNDIVGDFIFIKEFVKGNCADKYSIDYFKLFTPEDEYGDNEENQITAICDYLIGLHDNGKYLDSDLEEMYGNRINELYVIRQRDRDKKYNLYTANNLDAYNRTKNPLNNN